MDTSTADDKAWEDAERQVREAGADPGRSTVVSVKSQKKRKVADVDGDAADAEELDGAADKKKRKEKKPEQRNGEKPRHKDKAKDRGRDSAKSHKVKKAS